MKKVIASNEHIIIVHKITTKNYIGFDVFTESIINIPINEGHLVPNIIFDLIKDKKAQLILAINNNPKINAIAYLLGINERSVHRIKEQYWNAE